MMYDRCLRCCEKEEGLNREHVEQKAKMERDRERGIERAGRKRERERSDAKKEEPGWLSG